MLLADTPTLGLLIGLPIGVLIVVACLVLGVWAFHDDERGIGWSAFGAAAVVALIAGVVMFPFQHDYHFWSPVNGKVERIGNRVLTTDSGVEQKYVLTVNGTAYGVSDTRASQLRAGDTVALNCKKAYQFMSQSGWDCRWAGGTVSARSSWGAELADVDDPNGDPPGDPDDDPPPADRSSWG